MVDNYKAHILMDAVFLTHTHKVGTQRRSKETGNDSRGKRPFQREDRCHSIKEKSGRREQKTQHPAQKQEKTELYLDKSEERN